MTNHREIVARGFRIGGWVLGLPSLVALLAICVSLFFVGSPPDKSAYLDIGKYRIAGLLANSAKGVGEVFDWLGGIAVWFEEVLAAGLVGSLLFAIILYFVGRGIALQSPVARIAAISLSVMLLLFWLVVLLSLPRSAMVVPGLGIGVSVYAIWALGWT